MAKREGYRPDTESFETELIGKGYMLVVDDSYNMRQTIRNMLVSIGIPLDKVKQTDDGDSAIEYIRTHPGCSGIITDWNMPRMSGIELVGNIRAGEYGEFINKKLPIVMVTAETNRSQVAQAGETGVSGFLIKPFTANDLCRRLTTVMKNVYTPNPYAQSIMEGDTYLESGLLDQAMKSFRKAIDIKKTAVAMTYIGDVHEAKGDGSAARMAYAEALEINPDYIRANKRMAELLIKRKELELAIQFLLKACELSPNNAQRHAVCGNLYLDIGDKDNAYIALKRAIAVQPDLAAEIAEKLAERGFDDEAEEFYRVHIRQKGENHGNISVYNKYGIVLRRKGRWEDAVRQYEIAMGIEDGMKDPNIHFNMGKAWLAGKRNNKARASLQKALVLDPQFKEASDLLASVPAE